MSGASERRLVLAWLALSAITGLSWWIGARHGRPAFEINGPISFGVILIAALKVRIIVGEFMEARQAPGFLRRIADAWLALLVVSLLSIYVLGTGIRFQSIFSF